ncbi:hypothetical protein RJT34_09880 [Clitoria ternatea]|uniref:PUM-HD domain-containing protein n=1 Tax=Clitoria ternatea TaxID=43366 RepID=A0AAN9K8A8_CLITE
MLKISDDNKRNMDKAEQQGSRLIGIPNAPTTPTPLSVHNHHHNHHHYNHLHHHLLHPDNVAVGSPVSRIPFSSSSSSSTPISNDILLPAYSASTNPTKLCFDSNPSTLTDTKWVEDLALSNDFSRMNIRAFDGPEIRGYNVVDPYAFNFDGNVSFSNETGTLPYVTNNGGVSTGLFGKGYTFGTPLSESSPLRDHTDQMYHYHLLDQRKKQQQLIYDRFLDCEVSWKVKTPYRYPQVTQHSGGVPLNHNANAQSHYYPAAAKERVCLNAEVSQSMIPGRTVRDPSAFRCDNSVIIQGKDVKNPNGYSSLRGYRRSPHDENNRIHVVGENVAKNLSHAPSNGQGFENNGIFAAAAAASDISLAMQLKCFPLAEVQSRICEMAKDQNGCRCLQGMVDEGTYEDMCAVFEGIIGNIVELMMDSFGNYLVQKLLDVCSEDQRLKIVLMLTKEPGQLIRISLNTHGTRVVQKLIETLNNAKQISLVRSAIQPGFLDLIKDLNGNHVIQRCLQCLSCQDNQFIFEAAVKFCVEIATHRHGCCVLQRCYDHSVGKHREKLVTEICKHGLLLAQDPFGNYVVQYIIHMETSAAAAKMLVQFKDNYVILSTQKFSSHVVEKCLKCVADSRSRIVRELLSAPHFEQLLQDPYANYVIQSALSVTKGSLHASLVEAVRPFKILRTSPYCKRIFSGSLLKK